MAVAPKQIFIGVNVGHVAQLKSGDIIKNVLPMPPSTLGAENGALRGVEHSDEAVFAGVVTNSPPSTSMKAPEALLDGGFALNVGSLNSPHPVAVHAFAMLVVSLWPHHSWPVAVTADVQSFVAATVMLFAVFTVEIVEIGQTAALEEFTTQAYFPTSAEVNPQSLFGHVIVLLFSVVETSVT